MLMHNSIRVVGLDPSLRNWGVSKGSFDLYTNKLTVDTLDVINPVLTKNKQVRQNSLDLESAKQLFGQVYTHIKDAHVVCVEVPHGSQSARAMASYGICVGVLGAIRASAVPFIEVSAAEVKLGSVGKKTATKQEMIQWATNNHPEAPWPTYKEHGKDLISEAKAEHMADAIASIYAGRETNQFQQLIQILKANHANHPQAA